MDDPGSGVDDNICAEKVVYYMHWRGSGHLGGSTDTRPTSISLGNQSDPHLWIGFVSARRKNLHRRTATCDINITENPESSTGCNAVNF